jgi:OmpA-OmpF porin, OOP family
MSWWKNTKDDDRQEVIVFALLALAALSALGFVSYKRYYAKRALSSYAKPVAAIPALSTRFHAEFEPHRVKLSGLVDSPATAAQLLARVKTAFPKAIVEDQMRVFPKTASSEWLAPSLGMIDAAHEVRWGNLECSNDGIKLVGEVPSEDVKAAVLKQVSAVSSAKAKLMASELSVVEAPKVDPDALKADLTKHLDGKVVEFETGSDKLTAKGRVVLDELVPSLKELSHIKIEVGGHTDNAGDPAKNQDLSEKRAKSCIAYLGGKGVDTTHLAPKGYGDTKPKASNETPQGKQQNRRIEFEPEEVH